MTAALKANGKTAEYNYDFRSGTTGIFQKSQKFCPSIQQFCPLKIEQNSDFQKIQKPATIAITGFVGGEGGIRTHVPGTDNRISSAARYDHFDTAPY